MKQSHGTEEIGFEKSEHNLIEPAALYERKWMDNYIVLIPLEYKPVRKNCHAEFVLFGIRYCAIGPIFFIYPPHPLTETLSNSKTELAEKRQLYI